MLQLRFMLLSFDEYTTISPNFLSFEEVENDSFRFQASWLRTFHDYFYYRLDYFACAIRWHYTEPLHVVISYFPIVRVLDLCMLFFHVRDFNLCMLYFDILSFDPQIA